MNKLNVYIFNELLKGFFLILFIFLSIAWLLQFTRLISVSNLLQIDSLSIFKSNYNSFLIVKDLSCMNDDNSLYKTEKLGGKTFALIKSHNFSEINIYTRRRKFI